jgi:hypothetical protein
LLAILAHDRGGRFESNADFAIGADKGAFGGNAPDDIFGGQRVAERGFTGQNWLTFRQALKIGAHVRKGETGTTVVYADRFIPYRERRRAAETGDEPDAIPFLKRFTVFNADHAKTFRPISRPHSCPYPAMTN